MTTQPVPTPQLIAAQVRDRSRRLIRASGEIVLQPEPKTIDEIKTLLHTDGIDMVSLRHFGYPTFIMTVVDRGYETEFVEHDDIASGPLAGAAHFESVPTKALLPVNAIATALYHANCVPGTTHQIVGDVFVSPDNDFAGPDEQDEDL